MALPLRSTLLAEGTSDRALLPIIALTLAATVGPDVTLDEPRIVESDRLPRRIKADRGAWIRSAVTEFPCDLLFVHRDADKDDDRAGDAGRVKRLAEIADWQVQAGLTSDRGVTIVPIVPVRMTETWLLVDEPAIRTAANNPRGTEPLGLPALKDLEGRRGVKQMLEAALRTASGLNRRRLDKFNLNAARGRIAVTDLSRLRGLPAFAAFERDVATACQTRNGTA